MARPCGDLEDSLPVDPRGTGGTSRRAFVRRGAVAGAAAVVGGTFLGRRARATAAVPSEDLDAKIFNFALLLEYLQAAFYGEAVGGGALRGDVADFAHIVAEHERQHVDYLRRALGTKARPRPAFDFGDAIKDRQRFLSTAVQLENLGVVAYNGQAANLTKPALAAAAEIVSVEGRHAAWISDLAGVPPAPHAADVGQSAAEVVAALRATRFIRST